MNNKSSAAVKDPRKSSPSSAPSDNVTTSEDWVDIWLDAFGDSGCGIWKATPETVGVCIPYRIEALPVGRFRVRAARGTSNDHTPRYDILGGGRIDYPLLRGMMSSLGVHCLVFPYLEQSSRLLRAVDTASPGRAYHLDFCENSPYVDCTGNWEDYWSQRGKTRSTWARRERRMLRDEGASLRVLSTRNEVEQVWERLLEIEASGWKGEMGSAIVQSEDTSTFYGRLVPMLADAGKLRLFVLDRPETGIIAFQITACSNGVLYQMKVGYDDRYRKSSPGQVLQLQLLRWCFARDEIQAFDFLGGGGKAASNKYRWSTDVTPLHTLYVFAPGIWGRLAWLRYKVAPALKTRLYAHSRPGDTQNR